MQGVTASRPNRRLREQQQQFHHKRRKSVLAWSGYLNEAYLTQAVKHGQDLDRQKGRVPPEGSVNTGSRSLAKAQGLCLWQ